MKTFAKSIFLIALFSFFTLESGAQCPPSPSEFIHVVQKGESLWGISKKYYLTVDEVSEMNDIKQKDALSICQQLVISPKYFSQGQPELIAEEPTSDFTAPGNRHVIQEGETIAGIAELYGYTEKRFRKFNRLSLTEPAWPNMTLKTSDCDCPPANSTNPEVVDVPKTQPSPTRPPERETNWQPKITPTNNNSRPSNSFEEDPFGEDDNWSDWSSTSRTNTPTSFEEPTVVPSTSTEPAWISQPPVESSGGGTDSGWRVLRPDEQLAADKNNPCSGAKKKAPNSFRNASTYMSPQEIEMVNEINLVRSNPSAYVKYVEEYKSRVAVGRAFGSVATCEELIGVLKRTPRLSILKPTECIYLAAKKHGESQRPTGDVNHEGTDGSLPWDRVCQECDYMTYGKENIVAGPSVIRDAVIMLLVDDKIEGRGHRTTMLDPRWSYVACYKVGKVPGKRTENWYVQKFGE